MSRSGAPCPTSGGVTSSQIGPYRVRIESVAGEGGYATIYKVRDLGTGVAYALKVVRLARNSESPSLGSAVAAGVDLSPSPLLTADLLESIRREVKIMQQLKGHPNILRLHASQLKGLEEAHLLLDYCQVPLKLYMGQAHAMGARTVLQNEHLILDIVLAIAEGLAWMHGQPTPLVHRDIKPENVLLHVNEREGNLSRWVLCDFGSVSTTSQVFSQGQEIALEEEVVRRTTTPAYRAPELWDLYSGEPVGTQADMWALGCTLYWLIYGRLPFDGDSALAVVGGRYELPPAKEPMPSPAVAQLIRDLLQVSPRARPTAAQVVARIRQMRTGSPAAAAEVQQQPAVAAALQADWEPNFEAEFEDIKLNDSSRAPSISATSATAAPAPAAPPPPPPPAAVPAPSPASAPPRAAMTSASAANSSPAYPRSNVSSRVGSFDAVDLPPSLHRSVSGLGITAAEGAAVGLVPSPMEPREELLEGLSAVSRRGGLGRWVGGMADACSTALARPRYTAGERLSEGSGAAAGADAGRKGCHHRVPGGCALQGPGGSGRGRGSGNSCSYGGAGTGAPGVPAAPRGGRRGGGRRIFPAAARPAGRGGAAAAAGRGCLGARPNG